MSPEHDQEQARDRSAGATRGTEHLQAAGRELIAAARAFLDVAEEAVEDSQVVEEATDMIRDVVHRMGNAAREGPAANRVDLRDDQPGGDPADRGGDEGDAPPSSADRASGSRRSRVRRIDVE